MATRAIFRLFSIVLLLSPTTLLVSRYLGQCSRNYSRWSDVLEKDIRDVSATKEKIIESDQEQIEDAASFQPAGGEKHTVNMRSKLSRNVLDVEHDILNMKIRKILSEIPEVSLEESRLVHKMQRAERKHDYDCVIRIAKYCGNRCDHLIQTNYSREWTSFECFFTKFCKFETRYLGRLTEDIMQTVDVVLVVASLHAGLQLKALMELRPPGQLWVLQSRESPSHDAEYAPDGLTGNPFNLSVTYAKDSDIYFPYCTLNKEQVSPPAIPKKTKLMTWMASNCHLLSWRRGEFVRELQKHISVDTYGKCGDKGNLPRHGAEEMLSQYKFYLAFENSECRDYITEKAWRSLLLGIVPIVYGAKREDYQHHLPRNSFIFVEDFSNMSAFVDFIRALDADEARYNRYFDWRSEVSIDCFSARAFFMYSPDVHFCYLVKKLVYLYVYPETSWQKKTPDFASWWRGQCLDTTSEKIVMGFNVHQAKMKRGKPPE